MAEEPVILNNGVILIFGFGFLVPLCAVCVIWLLGQGFELLFWGLLAGRGVRFALSRECPP